jgi:arylsulfatase A-like enzyme
VTSPVGLVDLMPTLLDLLDVEGPPDVEGTSLVPMIESADGSGGPEWVFMQSGYHDPSQLAVRHGRWKLVQLRSPKSRAQFGAELQLYDLSSDPAEERNVVAENPEVARRMQEALAAWVEKQEAAESRFGPGDDEVDLKRLDERSRKALEALGYVEK